MNKARQILNDEIEYLKELGFDGMNVGFEHEFSLFNPDGSPSDNDAHAHPNRRYASASLFMSSIMRPIIDVLKKEGIMIESATHECGASQYEITYPYADAVESCDKLLIAKSIIEEVALQHGLVAHFTPKPSIEWAGNGLHTNVSLRKKHLGEMLNSFSGKDGKLSRTADNFIAGILHSAKGLTRLTNPTESSYDRFVDGHFAPIRICWGQFNRSALLRVPIIQGNSTRIEVRSPDNTMNPYTGIAGILRSGIHGIENNLTAPDPIEDTVHFRNMIFETIPTSLNEATAEYEKNEILHGIL